MTTPHIEQNAATDREMILSREYDAPRDLVFEAWTKPEHIAKWWGPNGFTTTIHEMAVTPGGRWRFIMHGPNGTDYDNRVVYHEVSSPERLVYEHGSDIDDDPERFHVTVTFEDLGGRTRVTMRTIFPTAEQRQQAISFGADELGKQTLDRLAAHLASL